MYPADLVFLTNILQHMACTRASTFRATYLIPSFFFSGLLVQIGPIRSDIVFLDENSTIYERHSFQGEIDILEGVNDQGTNQATLHTNAGAEPHYPVLILSNEQKAARCRPAELKRGAFGLSFCWTCVHRIPILRTSVLNNCDVAATQNSGCGVKVNDARSYGPTFNSNGGGW
jgi:hypothetical protein